MKKRAVNEAPESAVLITRTEESPPKNGNGSGGPFKTVAGTETETIMSCDTHCYLNNKLPYF
jgi:hypothetical protein